MTRGNVSGEGVRLCRILRVWQYTRCRSVNDALCTGLSQANDDVVDSSSSSLAALNDRRDEATARRAFNSSLAPSSLPSPRGLESCYSPTVK